MPRQADLAAHVLAAMRAFLTPEMDFAPLEDSAGAEDLAALLIREGLVGVYSSVLRERGMAGDAPLEKALAAQWTTNLQLAAVQDEVCDLFDENKMTALILKGGPLSERLYGDALLRPTSDVDVLVKDADLTAVLKMLEKNGYGREITAVNRHDFHIRLVSQRFRAVIEIHWNLSDRRFAFDPAAILARTGMQVLSGRNLLVMESHDELLYLAYHHAINGFVNRWILLLDVVQSLRRPHGRFDWPLLRERMRMFGVRNAVSKSFAMALEYFAPCLSSDIQGHLREITGGCPPPCSGDLTGSPLYRSAWRRRIAALSLPDTRKRSIEFLWHRCVPGRRTELPLP